MGGSSNVFRVEDCGRCRLVYGEIPIDDLMNLFSRFSDKAVIDQTLARIAGANLAVGEPADTQALREKPAPEAIAKIVSAYGHLGLSEAALQWLATGEQGNSSQVLFFQTTGISPPDLSVDSVTDHPRDVDDFRRCLLLMETVPEVRENLEIMCSVSPTWDRIVDAWSALTQHLHAEEFELAQERLKSCLYTEQD